MTLISNSEYNDWIANLKTQVRQSQQKASLAVNSELIKLYWSIGKQISAKQNQSGWGAKVVEQLANDLSLAFPAMKGFSPRNLKFMRQFSDAWPDEEIGKQAVSLIPWGHNIALLQKIKTKSERLWYANKVIENGWSRAVLVHQIESKLITRQGNAVNNFASTLPSATSELAAQTLKDPYTFDFLNLAEEAKEREIEQGLIKHLTAFLLELGRGFALVGTQYNLNIGGDDFYIDLLFFNITLNCYFVIELKADKLTPQDIGQLNFYLAAVDGELKKEHHAPTIGLLLCKERNRVVAEYAVRNSMSPIGIAEYTLSESLPQELQDGLPTIEDIEASLSIELKEAKGDD